MIRQSLLDQFSRAVASLDRQFASATDRLSDRNVDAQLKLWLDGTDEPLPWAGSRVTPDEWFLITTCYGQRTLPVQRALIRRYLPRFVREAGRDMRALTLEVTRDWVLDQDWMRPRLLRMAKLLRDRQTTMQGYAEHLLRLEQEATPGNCNGSA